MFAVRFLGQCVPGQAEMASRVGTQLCFGSLQHRPVSGEARASPGSLEQWFRHTAEEAPGKFARLPVSLS